MHKRLLALFLSLALIISYLPLGITAEGEQLTAAPAPHSHGTSHVCEDCEDKTVQWTAWTKTNQLPNTTGHYYLTGNVTVTWRWAVSGTNQVVLCLNGYTISGNKTAVYEAKDTGKLVISDCTAYTDAEGNYTAGSIANGTDVNVGGAFYVQGNGQLYMYGGKLTGHKNTQTSTSVGWSGGAIHARGNGYVYLKNCEISDNHTTAEGGAICLRDSATVSMENVTFRNNKADRNGGVIYLSGGNNSAVMKGCTFEGNSAASGGVIGSSSGKVTVESCTFTGNKATGNGAAFNGTGGSLVATGCTFTGHTATDFGVICGTGGGVKVTLDSCRVTENSVTGDTGAVFVPNSGCQLNIKGSTYIYGNTRKGGLQGNVYLQNDPNGNYSVVNVSGLTAEARIGIHVAAVRLAKTRILSTALGGSLTRAQVIGYFRSDDPGCTVDLADDKLVLTDGHVHKAHLTDCTAPGCTGHEDRLYLPWTDPNSLPTSGSYYLDVDVTTKSQPKLTTGKLDLCLNGRTITIVNRFDISGDAVLNITDCTAKTENDIYTAGKITGSTGTVFYMTGDPAKKSYVNLYEGIVTGNHRTNFHASVAYVQNGATLNMYGGEISHNSVTATYTEDKGGTVYLNDSKGTFNMYGGRIAGNTVNKNTGNANGGHGGAVYSNGGTVNILGGEISGNTAAGYGGAIWAKGGKVTVKDAAITGNTAASGSAIFGAGGGVQITLDNAVITDNKSNSLGAVYIPNNGAKITVSGATKIENNQGGNVYLVKDSNTTSPNHPMITLGSAGLGENAHIGITMPLTRISAEPYASLALGGKLTEDRVKAHFFCDDTEYEVVLKEDRLLVQPQGGFHIHCVCGTPDCTEHPQLEYKAWTDPTSLPAEGNWYLFTDVTISKEVTVKKDLNLCLNGHKVTGKTAGDRFYSTNGTSNEVLTISDCTAKLENGIYTAGGFYNNTYTNTGVAGGAIFARPNSTLHFYDGIIDSCSAYAGGGAIYGNKGSQIIIYNGKFVGNTAKQGDTWKNGGVIYLLDAALTVHDGQFTGNEAGSGSVIYTSGKCALDIRGGSFTGNIAHGSGAILAPAGGSLAFSGTPVITGNTGSSGTASNVYLGSCVMDVENLDENAKIGVTAPAFCAITAKTRDYTENFFSDDPMVYIVYQNEVLYTLSNSDHKHCICAMASAQGCDHSTLTFAPWKDPTAMPTSGNYYLEVDVTVTSQAALENTTLNLCLHGHTVTVGKQGGRVYKMFTGAKLSITDCAGGGKFTGATQGMLLSDSAGSDMELNLYNGILTGNHSKATGAALVVQGGCVFNMYGGRITGNSASAYLTLDANGDPKLDANGNQVPAAIQCGGVYVGAGATINMYGGEISGNKAIPVAYLKAGATTPSSSGGSGGGLYVTGSVANLYGGRITGNEGTLGGGIYVRGTGGILNLAGTEVSGNKGSSGGGIISQTGGEINLKSSVIKNNTATSNGAGIYVSSNTSFHMTGGEISGNTGDHGAGIFFLSCTAKLSGGVITGNTAKGNGGGFGTSGACNITVTNIDISKNTARNGGGILLQGETVLEMSGGKISGNKVSSQGGGGFISANTSFTMTGGSIVSNTATASGGGLNMMRAKLTLKGGSISYNTGANGGGLNINGGTVVLSGGSIESNRAIGTLNKTTGKYTGGNGGGIVIGRSVYSQNGVTINDFTNMTVYHTYIAHNRSNAAAGGILVQSDGTRFNMYGGTFAYNESATSEGGGAYFSSKSRPNVQNVSFYGNKAKNGGGFYLQNTTATFENIKLYDNQSTASGAAFLVTGADALVHMKELEIYDNTANGSAGAFVVQSYATLNLDGARIYGNTAGATAGAIYFSVPGYATMKNIQVYENTSEKDAGGIYIGNGSLVTIEDSTVRDNVSGGTYGGGIASRGRLDIRNTKILNNQTAEYGGGLAAYTVASRLTGQDAGIYAENCVISGNRAAKQGGGAYNQRGGPIYLDGCTLTDNTAGAEGGAVYSDGRLGLTDATVTGNTSGGEGYAVYVTAGEFDGHSYSTGHKKFGGNMIIRDNENGDLYLGEGTTVAIVDGPLGEKSHMEVTLHSGVLTKHLFGVYGYEGSDLHYTVTAGDRSIADPETDAQEQTSASSGQQTENADPGDIWLYVGIGALALIAIAAVVLTVKKKAGKPAGNTTKE